MSGIGSKRNKFFSIINYEEGSSDGTGGIMFFRRPDINAGAEEYRAVSGAVLVDVREADEFASGHIPGAINLPLSALAAAEFPFSEDAPVYVYCLAGTRAGRAVQFLENAGFTNVKNIGGIKAYRGPIEK